MNAEELELEELKRINHQKALRLATAITGDTENICFVTFASFIENYKNYFKINEIFKIAFPKNGISMKRKKEIISYLEKKKLITSRKNGKENKIYFLNEHYYDLAESTVNTQSF